MKLRGANLLMLAGSMCLSLLAIVPSGAEEPGRAVPAERIVVAYQGGKFHIVSRIALVKVLPPSDELPGKDHSASGFWFELQSQDGTAVYRKLIQDPTHLVFEGPREPGGPPERHEVALAQQVFTVLVPKAGSESSLVIFGPSRALGESARTAPAVALARLSLAPAVEGGDR